MINISKKINLQNRYQYTKILRNGWTTGACATAATKSAFTALLNNNFLNPVSITLPKGNIATFYLAFKKIGNDKYGKFTQAAIIKDAGDDPDVTHGALIISKIRKLPKGNGIKFIAGSGVGIVKLKGLPIAVGHAAINPIPRKLMQKTIYQIAKKYNISPDVEITISIPNGENIAKKTWNPRLGIIGGLSILGTTGIVNPFSCSAWISSIYSGVDVARAAGINHIAGSTGNVSEITVSKFHNLKDIALIDMGDFVGGLLKYLRNHPIDRVTIAGGFAKITKLAMGFKDLHSSRCQINFNWMKDQFILLGASDNICQQIKHSNTALECLNIAQVKNIKIGEHIANLALIKAKKIINYNKIKLDILITNHSGDRIAHKE